jgi:uncharacterized coiled-coil protein SlyX
VLALEVTVSKNESVINDLNSVIKENAMELQCKSGDLEKKSQELSQHKAKSANEVSNYCSVCVYIYGCCNVGTYFLVYYTNSIIITNFL